MTVTWLREAPGERIARHSLRAAAKRIVIDDAAVGLHSTSPGARVRALVLVARSILRALRVDDAFWFAIRRDSHERFLAGAHGLIVHGAAQTVRSARRRRAWISDAGLGVHFRLEGTDRERIADVSGLAGARGNVIDDGTLGTHAAHAWAGIAALVADASLVRGTIRAQDALRLAALVRIPMVVVDAYASARVISLLADRVGTARRRLAWIYSFLCVGEEDLMSEHRGH